MVAGVGSFFTYNKFLKPEPKKVHFHAGVVVFKNNKQVDFSDEKYMKTEPCTVGHEEETYEDIQLEKAHLHDNVGDVVHSERSGATWGDFFKNIKYEIDYSKVKAYSGGKELKDFQNQAIVPYDSVVVFIGENNKELLKKAVTKEYIKQKEKKSDGCGK